MGGTSGVSGLEHIHLGVMRMVLHSTCELVHLEIFNALKICVPLLWWWCYENSVNICSCSQWGLQICYRHEGIWYLLICIATEYVPSWNGSFEDKLPLKWYLVWLRVQQCLKNVIEFWFCKSCFFYSSHRQDLGSWLASEANVLFFHKKIFASSKLTFLISV